MTYVFLVMMGVFAVGYTFIRRGESLFPRLFFKCTASVMFVLVAFSARTGAPGDYYGLILGGLCASLAGDTALLFTGRGNGYSIAGMAAFAVAHGLYISAFWTIASPSWVDAVFFAVLMTLAVALLYGRRMNLGRSKFALYIYVALLCAMTSRALSMLWAKSVPLMFSAFAAGGGVLFTVSDLLLGIEHQTGRKIVGSVSTIVYYAAQGLFALTVMLAPR